MELMNIIQEVGTMGLFLFIVLKQQEKKDNHMMQTNETLLETNATLAKSSEKSVEIMEETRNEVKAIHTKVIEIADVVGVKNG